MRAGFAVVMLLASTAGCSSLLDFDDVSFEHAGDASVSVDASGDLGSDTGTLDSSVEGAAGATGQDAAKDGFVESSADAVTDVGTEPDACDGVTCSGHGTCQWVDGGPACDCEMGYHADGVQCVADENCDGVDCGRCGQCEVVGGLATCTCPTGFSHNGSGCVTDPNPCDTVDCGPDGACVPEAHCQPLGACVPTCDCSNCGNCGPDNTDGRWNDWQEYCGAEPDQSPATIECTKPCPNGDGCLPYSQPICWPMEGCFSL